MKVSRNPNRPSELMNPKKVEKIVSTLETLRTLHVRKTLAITWGIVLWMIFSLIVTVHFGFIVADVLRSAVL